MEAKSLYDVNVAESFKCEVNFFFFHVGAMATERPGPIEGPHNFLNVLLRTWTSTKQLISLEV